MSAPPPSSRSSPACRWIRGRWTRLIPLLLVAISPLPLPAQTDAPAVFYPTRYYPDSPDQSGAAPIALAPGDTSAPLVLTLAPSGGSIAVRVVAQEDAVPVAGILVEAVAGRFVSAARTGVDGRALLSGVPAGPARVRTRPDDPRSVEGGYAARYAPGVSDPLDAALFRVENGSAIDAGEILVPRAGRIKATCLRPGGLPWAGVSAVLRSVDGATRRVVRAGPDGRAHFGGLEPGAYRLWVDATGTEAITECSDGTRDTLTASEILVAEGDLLTGIAIAPDLGGAISGTVRHRDSNAGLPYLEVRAVSQSEPGRIFTGRTDPLGFYSVRGLPTGTYKVHVPDIRRWFPEAPNEAEARAVSVAEPNETFQINVRGTPASDCELPPAWQGVVRGNVRASFSLMPRAVIEIRGAEDTVRQAILEPGDYRIGCLRAGDYRAAFLPEGGYRTQYHRKTNSADSATVFTVAAAETTFAVDFEPQRSVVLQGTILSPAAGLALEGIPVFGERDGGGRIAHTVTDASGGFRIDRLPDGTGLPEGIWRVGTDSIIVGEIAPTALETISISATRAVRGRVRIDFHLGPLDPIDWRLERDDGGGAIRIVSDALRHPEGTRARWVADADGAHAVSYRLTVWIAADGWSRPIHSDWTAAPPAERARLLLQPSPWDGVAALQLPEAARPDGCVDLISADGSVAARLSARGAILDPLPSGISSGIYFLRWTTAAGTERTCRLVVKR